MTALPVSLLYDGASVDVLFGSVRPTFGDLYLACGDKHPNFPPSGKFAFDSLSELQFEQVDDYFGVRSSNNEGDDVPIWLFPLVDGEPVDHHPGPFDGVRLAYSILRNPVRRAEHYLKCVSEFGKFGSDVFYRNRDLDLGSPPELSVVRADIDFVVSHWASEGIDVGTSKALKIDY